MLIFLGHNLPLKDCKLDLGAILDESGSIGSEFNYRKETDFIKDLAKDLTIGPSNTRVSVITFSDYADLKFKFNDVEGYNRTALYNALDALRKIISTINFFTNFLQYL